MMQDGVLVRERESGVQDATLMVRLLEGFLEKFGIVWIHRMKRFEMQNRSAPS